MKKWAWQTEIKKKAWSDPSALEGGHGGCVIRRQAAKFAGHGGRSP
jgi:hypothetical protein